MHRHRESTVVHKKKPLRNSGKPFLVKPDRQLVKLLKNINTEKWFRLSVLSKKIMKWMNKASSYHDAFFSTLLDCPVTLRREINWACFLCIIATRNYHSVKDNSSHPYEYTTSSIGQRCVLSVFILLEYLYISWMWFNSWCFWAISAVSLKC